MPKRIGLSYAIISLLFVAVSFLFRTQVQGALLPTVVKVGIYNNSPKEYLDANGNAKGLFPDILAFIAEKENWKLEYVFGTWEEGLARLDKREIDLMVDVAITDDRLKKYDFTDETVFNSWGVVFIPKNSQIVSFKDLENKKIGVLQSSVYIGGPQGIDAHLRSFGIPATYIEVDKQEDVFDLLSSGGIDAGIVSRVFALTNSKRYPLIKETDMFFSPTELRFALPKNAAKNDYLKNRLDYWMKQLKNGYRNTYQAILGANGLLEAPLTREVTPSWIRPAEYAVSGIAIIFILVIVGLGLEKIRTAKKLEESESYYRALVEAAEEAQIGIVVLQDVGGKEAKIISANSEACKIAGYTQKEALSMSISEVIPPVLLKVMLQKYRDRRQGVDVPAYYEAEIVRKDKSLVPVSLSVALTTINGKPATVVYVVNNTEKKRAEDTIQKSKQQLQDIIDFLPDATFVVDNQNSIIVWNKAMELLTNIPRKSMLGQDKSVISNAVYGKKTDILIDYLEGKKIASDSLYSSIQREDHSISAESFAENLRNGTGAYIYVKASQLRDQKGNVLAMIESMRDITSMKLSERDLKQSEQRYRKIFDDGPLGMITVAKDFHFLSANKAFCKMVGYSEAELKQMTFADITHPETLEKDVGSVKDLVSGRLEIYTSEKRYLKKDKTYVWVHITVTKIVNEKGEFQYFLTMIEDISVRKTAQQEREAHFEALANEKKELQMAKAKSEAVLKNIADGVIVVDKSGKIIIMNHSAENMLLWSSSDALGKPWYEVLKREDSQNRPISPDNGAIKAAISGKTTTSMSIAASYYYVRKDGTKFPIVRSVSPLILDGAIIGAINIFRDITTFKEIDTAKTEFVSIASHELRAPLGITKAFISMILDGDYGEVGDSLCEPLTEIQSSIERLIHLVNDILSVSRVEMGRVLFKLSDVDMKDIIDESVKSFQALVPSGVVLKVGSCQTCRVQTDEEKIREVVNNLIENAIKFTKKGSIEITSEKSGDFLCVSVADTGIGISEENQKKIFGKFFQVLSPETGKPAGTGLGLFLAKTILLRMGGKIWVESSILGKGTTFSFTLPISGSKQAIHVKSHIESMSTSLMA